MQLAKGQRWLFSNKLIIEVLDPSNGRCVVRQQGTTSQRVGEVNFYSIALSDAISGRDKTIVYLQGQDAPDV